MLNKLKNDYPSWIVIAGILLLFLEVFFFNSGLIFSLLISGFMIYLGMKRAPKRKGKLLFWGGIIITGISVFNMITFKFFLAAILIHFFIQYFQTKKNPKIVVPEILSKDNYSSDEPILRSKPLFENIFFGQQKTPQHAYEWNDINIQAGVGDTIVDFSYTVLPKGETVVFIRNLIGNIKILVPYETEVSIHHSVIAGSTSIFGIQENKTFNQVYQIQTPGFEKAEQKIKIMTLMAAGNLEVTRI
ncbi:cell wall-active antibiotics response protein LiaF [Neobacillus terrae]|uniref:cell wall-active antibiotics response protein LiaF n=1 Tax=Neobacillus terrae TaxID=3034837 RepID=UPI00140C26F3|nr:cell wall-active antibiotics response protein LiaF [Neobacillus terrae]NHM31521.1 cell wall-active antibiotics response protein [Neobacillus terrae]